MADSPGLSAEPKPVWPVKEGSHVVRHWRGDLSLARSFWVNGVALNLLFILLFTFIAFLLWSGDNMGTLAALDVVMKALFFPLAAWQLVGIWRSAEKHKVHTGRKQPAIVAQVLLGIFLISVVWSAKDIQKSWIKCTASVSDEEQFRSCKTW